MSDFNLNDDDETISYAPLSKGTEAGHYRIVDKIGAGGMGEIYLAEDSGLGRRVALKFLPERLLSDPQAVSRFRREAKAAARLSHPNVVTIHEVGEYRGNPFIAMEYIDGETLAARIRKAPLSIDDAIVIITQVARGLLAAHDMGIIHRDIKPSNIYLCSSGRAKIIDFGLARVAYGDSITESNVVLGTVGYNSPEQVSGEPIDTRTDIWSLGVLLYKMLTGKLPFKGEDAQSVMYSIKHSPPSDIAEGRSDIPPQIRSLYRKCLEKDPDDRPQSMAEVLNTLGIRAKPREISGSRPSRSRLRRWLPALIILPLIALGIWAVRTQLPDGMGGYPAEVRRIAVLTFSDQTTNEEVSGWPHIIQMLLVGNMTGTSEIGVVDPFSLNAMLQSKLGTESPPRSPKLYRVIKDAEINYVIDGTILSSAAGYQLMTNVIEQLTGEVVYSCVVDVAGEEGLPEVVNSMSNDILAFFQTRIMREDYDSDVQPWLSHRVDNIDALKAFMQANDFLFRGIPGSVRYLDRALSIDSLFVAPRIYLISGLVEEGRLDEARRHLQFLMRFEPEADSFERSMISWAGALIENDTRGQVNSLRLALEYSPDNNVLLYTLARSLYLLEEYRQVIATLQPVVDKEWHFSPAYYLLGISYCMLNEYSKARQVMERSLSLSPVYEQTYLMLASLAYREGRRDSGDSYEEAYLHSSDEGGRSRADAYTAMANNHLFLDLTDEGIRCYRAAIELRPGEMALRNELGELLVEARRWDEARNQYLTLLGLDSAYYHSYLMLGLIHDSLDDTSGAVEYYTEYLHLDSTGAEVERINKRIASLRKQ